MKVVVFGETFQVLSEPFKEELESGEYYEMPDDLVQRHQDATYELAKVESEVLDWINNHPMRSEQEDIEVAPTIPILPPGVDK